MVIWWIGSNNDITGEDLEILNEIVDSQLSHDLSTVLPKKYGKAFSIFLEAFLGICLGKLWKERSILGVLVKLLFVLSFYISFLSLGLPPGPILSTLNYLYMSFFSL